MTAANWQLSGNAWYGGINTSLITQSIVNKGLVQVFKKYGSNEWWALPDQSGVNQTSFGYSVGSITLMNQNVNGTTPTSNPGNQTFRVVVISPSQLKENPNVNWNDYKTIEKILGI